MASCRRFIFAAVVVGSVLGPSRVKGEGLSLYVEPDYTHVVSKVSDPVGNTTSSTTDELAHRYRLTLDRGFTPLVRLTADGLFEQRLDWNTLNAVPSRADAWTGGGDARLSLGSPVLGGALAYERRDDSTSSTLFAGTLHNVNEVYSAMAGWRPADLPSLDLRLSRTNSYDVTHQTADMTIDGAVLNATYAAFRQLRLDYYADIENTTDHLSDTVTRAVTNSFRATYQDTFNGGRTSALASYTFQNRISETTTAGTGGLVATPQLAIAGLSAVETFPATPDNITLAPNPALVDSNITVSANVNLGFSVALAGDTYPREMGLQFADPNTAVNAVYVYVDKQLPPEIASVYTWTAWKSDDNVTWTRVNTTGPVVFGAFQNRFEIPIEQTQARYLKVVTSPLPATVTADRRFSDVLVTDLQGFLILSAAQARGLLSITTHTATAALHHQLLDDPVLAYDFSGNMAAGPGGTTYVLLNGMSATKPLARTVNATARVARQDTGAVGSTGPDTHLGTWQYSAGVTAAPLPTLNHAVTYTGQYGQTPRGTADLNAVTLVNRAELYRGINAQLALGYLYNVLERGEISRGPTVTGNVSVVPNTMLTLSSTYYYAALTQTGGGLPASPMESERIDGSVSFSPVPAVYVSATISRLTKGPRPTTLASFGGSLSPFPDGSLLLRGSYTETIDTALNAVSRIGSASARWVIAAPVWLDVAYTVLRSTSDIGGSDIRTFTVGFVIQL